MTVDDKDERYRQKLMKSEQRVLRERQLDIRIYRIKMENNRYLIASQPKIPLSGVTYIPDFLNEQEQAKALDIVDKEVWDGFIARRQQYWGEIYYHTTKDVVAIQPSAGQQDSSSTCCPNQNESQAHSLPLEKFEWLMDKCYGSEIEHLVAATESGNYHYKNEPLSYSPSPDGIFLDPPDYQPHLSKKSDEETDAPTQILVNEYRRFQGISKHIDDPFAFGPVIALVSLVNPIWMYLQHTETNERFDFLLEPGSLLVLKGQARYLWTHAISKSKFFPVPKVNLDSSKEGVLSPETDIEMMHRNNDTYRRISLTIRRLLRGRKRVQVDSHEWIN